MNSEGTKNRWWPKQICNGFLKTLLASLKGFSCQEGSMVSRCKSNLDIPSNNKKCCSNMGIIMSDRNWTSKDFSWYYVMHQSFLKSYLATPIQFNWLFLYIGTRVAHFILWIFIGHPVYVWYSLNIIQWMSSGSWRSTYPTSTQYSIDIYRSSLECMISRGYPVDIYETIVFFWIFPVIFLVNVWRHRSIFLEQM